MPTPEVNGAASISQRTGGLRKPPSIEPRSDGPDLGDRARALARREAEVVHEPERDDERHAEHRRPEQVRDAKVGDLGDDTRRAPTRRASPRRRRSAPARRPLEVPV